MSGEITEAYQLASGEYHQSFGRSPHNLSDINCLIRMDSDG